MLVCSVIQRPRGRAIAADLAETAAANDASTTGFVVFATIVDDPANVLDAIDAFLGDVMVEAASAADDVDGVIPTTYSADVSETATATDTPAVSSAWTPANLTTLKGWYKADTLAGADLSTVNPWPDSSGLGNNATQRGVQPNKLQTNEQNGLNVVQTGGGGACFDLPNLLSGASACAAVFVVKTIGTGQGAPLKMGTYADECHYPYSDNNVYDDFGSTVRKNVGNPGSLTVWHIGSFHSAASSWKYYRNGVSAFTTTTNTVGIRSAPLFGSSLTPGTYPYDGMIGEMIIVNEFLSDSDRQKAEGYLAHKWGLAGSLDSGHPYKSAPP